MKRHLAAIISLLVGSAALAAPAASQPAMDFSTPRATLVTYFTLIAYGDLNALQKVSTVPTTPEEQMIAEVEVDTNQWAPHLIDAICDHFPKGMLTTISDPRPAAAGYKTMVANMQLDTLGDSATMRLKSDAPPAAGAPDLKIIFKKEGNDWKIVLKDSSLIPSMKDPSPKQLEFFQAMQACYSDTAAEVLAGKYTAPVLASKACDAKIKAVQQKYLHPATVPGK